MPYIAEGPGLSRDMTFYLGPDPALGPGGAVEFRYHDRITDAQYDAARPETKRFIDDLVDRGVLLKVAQTEVPAQAAGARE